MNQPWLSLFGAIILISFFHDGWSLVTTHDGTNVTTWSEDDWLENEFFINAKFMFNQQQYDHLILRARMTEWLLELSYGNASHLNRVWTQMHLYLDRRRSMTTLNHSLHISAKNLCRPPIISPLTNDSTVLVTELAEMDERIAKYFTDDGFFRTINYVHCTLNERRRNPLMHLQIEVYLVTNREFHSLLIIEMLNETRAFLADQLARVYIHNHELNFRYNFNLSYLNDSTNTNLPSTYIIKLYNPSPPARSQSMKTGTNILLFLFPIITRIMAIL